jgi:hypothetical protein
MVDSALRARVERLLGDDFRVDDLTRLFLSVRFKCDGRESVQEVGDFVAHRGERTKGIVSRAVREWFDIVQFFAPQFRKGGPYPIDWNSLPPNTQKYLTVVMKRITNSILKKEAGLTRAHAQRIFPGLLKKIEKNPDGTYRINPTISDKEVALLNSLCTVLRTIPAFTLDTLFKDFCDTLKSHGLLRKEEFSDFERFKTPIGLYAVSVMQNCWIQTSDALSSKLFAYYEKTNNVINVTATAPLPFETSRALVSMATAMFTMPIDASKFLHQDLTTMEIWGCDLEVNDAMMLIPLR